MYSKLLQTLFQHNTANFKAWAFSFVLLLFSFATVNAVAQATDTWPGTTTPSTSLSLADETSANSEENPYLINSVEDLLYLYVNPNQGSKYFKLNTDLNLSAHYWLPIGTSSSNYASLNFDGGGHTITGLTISPNSNNIGLFGYVKNSSNNDIYFKNLKLDNVSIINKSNSYSGIAAFIGNQASKTVTVSDIQVLGGDIIAKTYVGAIVGYDSGKGVIHNCTNKANVSGNNATSGYIGGIVGYSKGHVEACVNHATIENGLYVGGIVGYAYAANVTYCVNFGDIHASTNGGGIAGYVYSSGSCVQKCINFGNVKHVGSVSNKFVGGICGSLSGNITICFNVNYGTIAEEDVATYLGGICGYAAGSNYTVENNLNLAVIDTTSGGSYGECVGYLNTASDNLRNNFSDKQWDYNNLNGNGGVKTKYDNFENDGFSKELTETLASTSSPLGSDNFILQDNFYPIPKPNLYDLPDEVMYKIYAASAAINFTCNSDEDSEEDSDEDSEDEEDYTTYKQVTESFTVGLKNDGYHSWSSDNNLVSFDGSIATLAGSGSSTLTSQYKDSTFSRTIYIGDLSNATISLSDLELDDAENLSFPLSCDPIELEIGPIKMGCNVLKEGYDYTISYEDNFQPGTAKLIISPAENPIITGTKEIEFTITGTDLTNATTSLEKTIYAYTGNSIEIDKSLFNLSVDGELINTDYFDVTYENNTEPGTADAYLVGKCEYQVYGSVHVQFTIKQFDLSDAIVTLDKTAYKYTGSQITPTVTSVTFSDWQEDYELSEENKDFTVTYDNNTNISTSDEPAYVIISAANNPAIIGSQKVPFSIVKCFSDAEITLTKRYVTYVEGATSYDIIQSVSLYGVEIPASEYSVSFENINSVSTDDNWAKVILTNNDFSDDEEEDCNTVSAKFFLYENTSSSIIDAQIASVEYDGCITDISESLVTSITFKSEADDDIYGVPSLSASKLERDDQSDDGGYFSWREIDSEKKFRQNADYPNFGATSPSCLDADGNYIYKYNNTFFLLEEVQYIYDTKNHTGGEIPYSLEITNNSDDMTSVGYHSLKITITDNGQITCRPYMTATQWYRCQDTYHGSLNSSYYYYTFDGFYQASGEKDVLYTYTIDDNLIFAEDYELAYKEGDFYILDFIISPKSLENIPFFSSENLDQTEFSYNGEAHEPSLITTPYFINCNNEKIELEEGTDFTVSYENNVNAGTAYVIFTGIGNFQGEVSIPFTINCLDISNDANGIIEAQSIPAQPYTGNNVVFTNLELAGLRLKIDGTDNYIYDGLDYQVSSYSDNTSAGTATITIVPTNENLCNSRTINFTITPTDYYLVVSPPSYDYDGKEHSVTLLAYRDGTSRILQVGYPGDEDIDVYIDEENSVLSATEAGTYTITTYSSDTYRGSYDYGTENIKTITWEISALELNNTDLTLTENSFTYNGEPQYPESIVVSHNGTVLEVGTDYTITTLNKETKDVGTYEVTVTAVEGGNYTGTATQTYSITPRLITPYLSTSPASKSYTGEEITLDDDEELVVSFRNLVEGETVTFTYESKNYEDNIYAGSTAKYEVAVTLDETETNYELATDIITGQFSITAASVDFTAASLTGTYTYTGSPIEPTADCSTVPSVAEGITLPIEDTDYTVSYTFDNNTNAGEATITPKITWLNDNYTTGTITPSTFTISKADLTATLTVSGSATYTADYITFDNTTSLTPTITFTATVDDEEVNVTNKLFSEEDYTVNYTYVDNLNVGTATATPVFEWTNTNYNEPKVVDGTFEIEKAEFDVSLAFDSQIFTGNEFTNTVTVTFNNETVDAKYYEVTEDSELKGTNVNTYHIYVNGLTNFSNEEDLTWEITPGALSFTMADPDSYTYSGKENNPQPALTFYLNGEQLSDFKEITDYTVTYTYSSNTISAGTAEVTATVTLLNNNVSLATNTATKPFTINPAALTASIDNATFTYNAAVQAPTLTVTGVTTDAMLLGTDYEIKESDDATSTFATEATNAGTYYFTVQGINNYTGNVTIEWQITTACFTVLPDESNFTHVYDAQPWSPTFSVLFNDAEVPTSDYTVTNNSATNAGSYYLQVSGNEGSNFADCSVMLETPWTITPAPITNVSISPESYDYNGNAQGAPTVTVEWGSETLTENEDYELTGDTESKTDVGTYTINISAIGNFTIENEALSVITWSINAIEFTPQLSTNNYDYTGETYTPTLSVYMGSDNTGTLLTNGKDYEYDGDVSASEAGTYTINIHGLNNFKGTEKTISWTINPAEFSVSLDYESFQYDATSHKPTPTVTFNGKTVDADQYTVSVTEQTDVPTSGAYSITVSGVEGKNFEGCEVTKSWTITPAEFEASLENTTFYYTEASQSVSILATFGETNLVRDIDYTVSGTETATAVGKYTLTVSGTGNFTGDHELSWSIENAELTVSASPTTFTYNFSAQGPTLIVSKPDGSSAVEGTDYEIIATESSDATFATTATNVGSYSYTISAIGSYIGSTIVNWSIEPANFSSVSISSNFTYDGTTKTATIIVYGKNASGTEVQLSQGTHYTVSQDTLTNAGSVNITISGIGNFQGAEATGTIVVNPATFTASSPECVTFTGSELTANISLTGSNGRELSPSEYEITGNTATNAGTYTATITGKGNFAGTTPTTTDWQICQANLADAVISTIADQTYTGSEITPQPTVTFNNLTLSPSTDYEVSYANNTNVGTATITFTATEGGNFYGTKETTFNIVPSTEDFIVSTISAETYNAEQHTPAPTVQILQGEETITLELNKDYTLTWGENINAGTGYVYIQGINNYAKDEVTTATFTINPLDISDESITADAQEAVDYNVTAYTPELNLYFDNAALTYGTDYSRTYANNINASETATVIFTGLGNFTGTRSVFFTINCRSLEDVNITAPSDATYTGSAIESPIEMSFNGETLTQSTDTEENDYTVTYTNNINAFDTPVVTISGKGNYCGTIYTTFDITQANIADATISTIPTQTFTGQEITPSPILTFNDITVDEETNYTLSYANNISVGTATITISAKTDGNFSGTTTTTFAIDPIVTDLLIAFNEEVTYTGEALTPSITVTANINGETYTLTEGVDYTSPVYSNNINASESDPYVSISGTGNYYTETPYTASFPISPRPLEESMIVNFVEELEYTGTALEPLPTLAYNGMTMNKDVDYTISFSNNINAYDVPVVTITGITNYTGSISTTFDILQGNLADAVVSVIDNQVYTGNEITPPASLTYKGLTVEKENNYTESYADNINVGTASITFEAIADGNFYGTNTTTFRIDPVEAELLVTFNESVTYTGEPLYPAMTVTTTLNGESVTLVENQDYTAVYSNNVNASGEAYVTITGINNYSSTASKVAYFTILQREVSLDMIVSLENATYTGASLEPAIELAFNNTPMSLGTDYGLTFSNNINAYDEPIVTISGRGNFTSSVETTFDILQADLAEADVASISSQMFTGSSINATTSLTFNTRTVDMAVNYDTTYVNNLNVGTATLTFTAKESGNFYGTNSTTFEIVPYSGSLIVTVVDTMIYTGSAQTPPMQVTTLIDGLTHKLTEGVDFTATYDNNINASSEALITVTGMGNYSSLATGSQTFVILPRPLSTNMVAPIDGVTYTGTAISPMPALTYNNMSLTEGSDFSVEYANNINAFDTPVVTISGKGNYSGTISTSFDILQANLADASVASVADQYYALGASITPTPALTYLDIVVSQATNYDISYENNINIGVASILFTAKETGNFYGTNATTFNIVPLEFLADATLEYESITYDGTEKTPVVTVTRNGITLVQNTDFTVAYSDNIEVGTATVTISPIGNFVGADVTKTFTITPMAFEALAELEYYTIQYDGTEKTPSVTASVNGTVVEENVDFTVSYSNNIEIGTATVTLTGMGNYSGTIEKTFTITTADLNASLELEYYTIEYNFTSLIPAVTVIRNGSVLDTYEYNVTYTNNDAIGTATVTVTGTNHYSGSVDATFEITAIDLSNAAVELEYYEADYTGNTVRPSILSVINNGRTLIEGTDFTVTYENCTVPGTATAVITGRGVYTGSVSVTYVINYLDLDPLISLEYYETVYNGEEKTPVVTVMRKVTNTLLTEGSDFTVEYVNNVNAGTATVIISAAGVYEGSAEETFTINRALCLVTVQDTSMVEKTTPPDFVINYQTVEIDDATGEITILFDGFYGGSSDLITEAVATVDDYQFGTHTISLSGAYSDNYDFLYQEDGTLTVEDDGIFFVWPNPVKTKLYVKGIEDDTRFTIVAIRSSDVLRGYISSRQYIDVTTLATGIYILKVGDHEVRFVKRK